MCLCADFHSLCCKAGGKLESLKLGSLFNSGSGLERGEFKHFHCDVSMKVHFGSRTIY